MLVYVKGRPTVITVDDRLPWGTSTPLFLRSKDSAYWAPIAEKVFTKYAVNYETIGYGWMNESTYFLTGVPTTLFTSKSFTYAQLLSVMQDAY